MRRYDLMTNYRCGSAIEEMEPSDDGEWIRYDDIEHLLGWDCDCAGGPQGQGLVDLPHDPTCKSLCHCDCITSGNANKPKQHGADPHAKNCNIYRS